MLSQEQVDAIQQRLLAVAELAGVEEMVDDLVLLFMDLKEARRLAKESCVHEKVRKFGGACKAHLLNDCQTCNPTCPVEVVWGCDSATCDEPLPCKFHPQKEDKNA